MQGGVWWYASRNMHKPLNFIIKKMKEIEKIIPEIGDYLDYSKVLRQITKEFSKLIEILDENEDRYFRYDLQIRKKLKSGGEKNSTEAKTLLKEVNEKIKKYNRIIKLNDSKIAKKVLAETEELYKKLEEAEINAKKIINEYEKLIEILKPIWKSIKEDKKQISKALFKSFLIQAGLYFMPFLFVLLILAFSFLNESLSSFLFSFSDLDTLLIFSIFSIVFYLITNKLTNYLYYKRLKSICSSNAEKLNSLRQSTDIQNGRVEKNYQIFYEQITKANPLAPR